MARCGGCVCVWRDARARLRGPKGGGATEAESVTGGGIGCAPRGRSRYSLVVQTESREAAREGGEIRSSEVFRAWGRRAHLGHGSRRSGRGRGEVEHSGTGAAQVRLLRVDHIDQRLSAGQVVYLGGGGGGKL